MSEPLSEKDRIGILLEEYKTLRAEIITRLTAILQLFALSATLLTGISAAAVATKSLCFGLIAGTLIVLGALAGLPEMVDLAKRLHLYPTKGQRRSLRDVAAELARQGYSGPSGEPYAAMAIKRMLEA